MSDPVRDAFDKGMREGKKLFEAGELRLAEFLEALEKLTELMCGLEGSMRDLTAETDEAAETAGEK